MQIFLIVYIWMLTVSCIYGKYFPKRVIQKESRDMQKFFDQMESMIDKLLDDSKVQKLSLSDHRKQRYKTPERNIADNIEAIRSLNVPFVDNSKNTFNSDGLQRRNDALEFDGYQDDVFRPLYRCDRFDAARRYCIFFRQLGSTLTLGVQAGEGLGRAMHIRWYRFLKKKQFDHYIRQPLNRDYLPWNLNLGGSENELRISPITEMDLSYNFFTAELVASRPYRPRKVTIRFSIEPIHIDMGSLYHGEEIVIYARFFMELPRSSVSYTWSIYDSNNIDNHGLPSNMRLNGDRSSVIIKELKTYQDQILTCSVYSNKNVFLARRNFLFRATANSNTVSAKGKIKHRHKRSEDSTGLWYDASTEAQTSAEDDITEIDESATPSDVAFEVLNQYQQIRIPEISQDLFYNNERREFASTNQQPDSRMPRLERTPVSYLDQTEMLREKLGSLPLKESAINKEALEFEESPQVEDDVMMNEQQQSEVLRFEDKESLTIATCFSNSDCNIHATCTRASFSGQKFCKCSHGYNGNGIFCFST